MKTVYIWVGKRQKSTAFFCFHSRQPSAFGTHLFLSESSLKCLDSALLLKIDYAVTFLLQVWINTSDIILVGLRDYQVKITFKFVYILLNLMSHFLRAHCIVAIMLGVPGSVVPKCQCKESSIQLVQCKMVSLSLLFEVSSFKINDVGLERWLDG